MKKKLLMTASILVILCMMLSLAACGGSSSGNGAASPAQSQEPAPASEALPADTTPAETTEPATPEPEQTDSSAAADAPPVSLIMSTAKNQTESGGIFIDYFCDYVEAASGGSITFERFYGGTLAGAMEELSMVSSGAVSVTALNHTNYADNLPLMQFPEVGFTTNEDCAAYYSQILFENGQTASLLQAEAERNNVKYLGFFAAGTRVWFSKTPINTVADGAGKKFGGMSGLALMEQLGFSTVAMAPPDCYENLSRGVCDLAGLSLTAAVDLMWYEVAPYCVIYGGYSCGNPITLNLDVWNSLTPEQQAVMEEAGHATVQYCLEYVADNEGSYIDRLENEYGCTVIYFDEENINIYKESALRVNSLDAYTRAQNQGIQDDMKTILETGAGFWNVDISDIFQ